MKSARKALACTLCAIFSIGVISVYAQWVEAGYDTSTPGSYGKIYNEIIGGKATSNHKIIPVDEKNIVWKSQGFELSYPHAGYDRLYLEGNWQSITKYNDIFAQWETRNKDFMWELTAPYEIYQRQQTYIPGKGWRWDFYPQDESKVFSPTNRNANVIVSYKNYGIADLTLDGYGISNEVREMYERFIGAKGVQSLQSKPLLSARSLSEKNKNGEYVVTDDMIAANIEIITSKFLTGPTLVGSAVVDVANKYLENGTKWKWDPGVVKADYNGRISWTKEMFEQQEPYDYYQCLIVNGMVMDGTKGKPCIYRKTGGKATPKITWKYAFIEKDYPYSIVEAKYINGVLAKGLDGKLIYRIPTGEYANSFIIVTATDIEVWVKNDHGIACKIDSIPRYRGIIGDGADGFAPGITDIP